MQALILPILHGFLETIWADLTARGLTKALKRPIVLWGEPGCGSEELAALLAKKVGRQSRKARVIALQAELFAAAELQKMLTGKRYPSERKTVFIFSLVRSAAEEDFFESLGERALVYRIPPLRERREFVSQLVHHFLRTAAKRAGKIDELAMSRLQNYEWPRNVTELLECLRDGDEACERGVMTLDDLPLPIAVASGEAIYPQRLPPELRR